eukprot:gene18466-22012_t
MAAGAQITHSRKEEVVTRNNETVLLMRPVIGMAAVIPALKMHRTIAAVKKLVVEFMPETWSAH